MESTNHILHRLRAKASSSSDPKRSQILGQAIEILESLRPSSDGSQPGQALSSLLTDVIKPLFATTANPNLTPSGRKNLVAPPPTTGRFNTALLDSDSKPWKQASWSVDVLKFIVSQYDTLPAPSRRQVLDGQFFLLVPPILALIDDGDIAYKTAGCEILGTLCNALIACNSNILLRTGLADIFADSLRTNFMLLPTLTTEDESIALLQELYPAFRALVNATYPENPVTTTTSPTASTTSQKGKRPLTTADALPVLRPTNSDLQPSPTPATQDRWNSPRQKLLDTLLRHGILASYTHCSTSHIRIATFLIQQATLTVPLMRLNATKHLSTLVPILRQILTDPLGGAYPPLLHAGLDLMGTLIVHCKERISSTWWMECLRALVGCWVVVRDEPKSDDLKSHIREVVASLGDIIGYQRFNEVSGLLIAEDAELSQVFAQSVPTSSSVSKGELEKRVHVSI